MKKIFLFCVILSSCAKENIEPVGDPSQGLSIYLNKQDSKGRTCVSCHGSPDGLDIVDFGKIDPREQDETVMKRSLEHVSREDAAHIVAYLKTLQARPNGNSAPIKAPTGPRPSEIWNGSTLLTREEVLGWDFWKIGVSFDFPKWIVGDNTNFLPDDNTDWLSEIGLPNEKPAMRVVFSEYLRSPTYDNLRRVIWESRSALTEGERHPGEHGYRDFKTAFDYQRWLSTLYMQHIRREGIAFGDSRWDTPEFSMLDPVWDAGNVARRSSDNGSPAEEIPNRLQNEVRWLYLAWLGNMGKRNSFETQYVGAALRDAGERDLASLVILRSMLHRSPNSQRLFDDLFSMTYIASPNLLYRSLVFGLNEVKRRLREDYARTRITSVEAGYVLTYYEEAKSNIQRSSMTSGQKSETLALLEEVSTALRAMR